MDEVRKTSMLIILHLIIMSKNILKINMIARRMSLIIYDMFMSCYDNVQSVRVQLPFWQAIYQLDHQPNSHCVYDL